MVEVQTIKIAVELDEESVEKVKKQLAELVELAKIKTVLEGKKIRLLKDELGFKKGETGELIKPPNKPFKGDYIHTDGWKYLRMDRDKGVIGGSYFEGRDYELLKVEKMTDEKRPVTDMTGFSRDELISISDRAMVESKIVENKYWKMALERLASSADHLDAMIDRCTAKKE